MRYFKSDTVEKIGGVHISVDMVRTIEYHLEDDTTTETNYIIHPNKVKVMVFPLLRGNREDNPPSTYSQKSLITNEPDWKEISQPDFDNLINGLNLVYYQFKED